MIRICSRLCRLRWKQQQRLFSCSSFHLKVGGALKLAATHLVIISAGTRVTTASTAVARTFLTERHEERGSERASGRDHASALKQHVRNLLLLFVVAERCHVFT